MVLQVLVVSRIVKYLGIARRASCIPVFISLGNYGLAAVGIGFAIFRSATKTRRTPPTTRS